MNGDSARQYATNKIFARSMLAQEQRADYLNRLHEAFPKLSELDSRINLAGFAAAKAVATGGDDSAELAELDGLRNERAEFLKKHKIEEKTFYHCPACRDTGSVNGAPCECYRQLVREYHAGKINQRSPLRLCSFEGFSLEYYSDKPRDGGSSRRKMQRNLEICRRFAYKEKGSPTNLLLFGYAGLGKTHLALSIANERILAGDDVIYCSSANIFREIEREYMTDYKNDTLLRELKACELLILDDFGSEHLDSIVVNAIYDLVNTRISEGRSTVYTTNITDKAGLEARYGESVASRLLGCCELLAFDGEDDIRKLLGAEKSKM